MSLRAARRILRSAVPDAPADLGGDQVSPLEQMLRALPAEELRRLAEALHEFAERPPDHQQQDDLSDEQRLGGCGRRLACRLRRGGQQYQAGQGTDAGDHRWRNAHRGFLGRPAVANSV